MQSFRNIKITTFLLFSGVGLAYLLATLFVGNQLLLPTSFNIQRILQLPFMIVSLGWFTVTLMEPLATKEKKHTIAVAGIFIIVAILLAGVLYLHFSQ